LRRLVVASAAHRAVRCATAILVVGGAAGAAFGVPAAAAATRFQAFQADPGWESHNARPDGSSNPPIPCRTVNQDFGFQPAGRVVDPGAAPGELGGRFVRSSVRAAFALPLTRARTLRGGFRFGGSFVVPSNPNGGNLNIGLYSEQASLGWRTPSSVFLRLGGRRKQAEAFVDVTSRHRLAASSQYRLPGGVPVELRVGQRYTFAVAFSPRRRGRAASVAFRIDGLPTVTVRLPSRLVRDGASMNRFGVMPGQIGAGVMEAAFDDVSIDQASFDFAGGAPGWQAEHSRETYTDCGVHARQDFGWEPATGTAGGQIWRTGPDVPDARAWYADRLPARLAATHRLVMSGVVKLRQSDSDSGSLIGWFDSGVPAARVANAPLKSFLGLAVAGPSAKGDELRPLAASGAGPELRAPVGKRVLVGHVYRFRLEYQPAGRGGRVLFAVGRRAPLAWNVPAAFGASAPSFDRFGLRNITRGGGRQLIRVDNLSYTVPG
jgi:hypothetical protein